MGNAYAGLCGEGVSHWSTVLWVQFQATVYSSKFILDRFLNLITVERKHISKYRSTPPRLVRQTVSPLLWILQHTLTIIGYPNVRRIVVHGLVLTKKMLLYCVYILWCHMPSHSQLH